MQPKLFETIIGLSRIDYDGLNGYLFSGGIVVTVVDPHQQANQRNYGGHYNEGPEGFKPTTITGFLQWIGIWIMIRGRVRPGLSLVICRVFIIFHNCCCFMFSTFKTIRQEEEFENLPFGQKILTLRMTKSSLSESNRIITIISMKKTIIIGLLLMGLPAFAELSPVRTAVFPGECIHSYSPNGLWMVSELDVERSLLIRNLETGEYWTYFSDGMDEGVDYTLAMTRDVSNDGTVIAEVQNVPSYWRNGEWTPLDGAKGAMAAIIGSITPDGSVIVGSVSQGSSRQTKPCVWRRQPDGSYGRIEFLPNPVRNNVENGAQYINANAISDDGKTIAVSYRSGSGFNNLPYVYIQDSEGNWTSKSLADELINAPYKDMPQSPGAYRGPSIPNFEAYMTEEELERFYAESGRWVDEQYALGYNDDEVFAMGYVYAAEFMSEENRKKYEPLARAFADAYIPWANAVIEYNKKLAEVADKIISFEFNNVFISPDGKYVYATAYKSILEDPTDPEFGMVDYHAPVRFDVATGEYTLYPFDYDMMITYIAEDYSILGWDFDRDVYLYRPAYIIPGGETEPIEIPEYFKEKGNRYACDWLEQNLYQEVLIGFTQTGAYMWEDKWCVGKPVATPGLNLWGFGVSTLYWSTPPEWDAVLSTYVFNPDNELLPDDSGNENEDSGVEGIISDDIYRVTNLQGITVLETRAYDDVLRLVPGLYIVNGKKILIKN